MKSILPFLCLILSASSLTVKCTYHNNGDWWVLKDFYYCIVDNHLNIDSPDRATIANVTGDHLPEMSLDDVVGFEADNMTVHYFPKGLDKIFKNLKMIDINNGRLREIHQSDLKPFPNLTCLELYENDIEALEQGLFDFNPRLEMIWLTSNRIIHIDVNLFDNLASLTYLSLDANRCISEYAEDNKTAVAEVIRVAKRSCSDVLYLKRVFPVFMSEFSRVKAEVDELRATKSEWMWKILNLLCLVAVFSSVGFLVGKKFYHRDSGTTMSVSFENLQCK